MHQKRENPLLFLIFVLYFICRITIKHAVGWQLGQDHFSPVHNEDFYNLKQSCYFLGALLY